MPSTLRDGLIVTMSMRMTYMELQGLVDVPYSLDSEDEIINFICITVDQYLEQTEDVDFDEFIETAIINAY